MFKGCGDNLFIAAVDSALLLWNTSHIYTLYLCITQYWIQWFYYGSNICGDNLFIATLDSALFLCNTSHIYTLLLLNIGYSGFTKNLTHVVTTCPVLQ